MKKIKRKIHQYTAVFEPDKESGGYVVTVPSLPGCISEGDTFEKALENIKEAADLYIEVIKSKKEKVPTEDHGVIVAPIQIKA